MSVQRIDVHLDRIYDAVMPHSEVCMHMGIAGKPMKFKLLLTAKMKFPLAQLYSLDGQPFSAPILTGEAGLYFDGSSDDWCAGRGFYFYPKQAFDAQE